MRMLSRYFFAPVLFMIFITACNKPNSEVTDFDWQVESIKVHADSAIRFAGNLQTYILAFDAQKNFSFKMDINNCGGTIEFKRGGNNISFSSAACTEACCDSDFAQKSLDLLLNVNKYEIVDNKLILFSENLKRIDFVKK